MYDYILQKTDNRIIGVDWKFQHLTEEEIKYIYSEDESILSKIYLSNRFKVKYENLFEFENKINLDMLVRNINNDSFPFWYIIRLVEYGRVTLELEIIMSIRLLRSNFLNVNSRLINLDFISMFEDVAINKLGYSKKYVLSSVTIALIKAMIFLQATEENLVTELCEYKVEIDKKVSLGLIEKKQSQILLPIAKTLKEMGYKIDIETFRNREIIIVDDILKRLHPGMREAVELYKEFLKTKNDKYYKTEISHIRIFFKFINSNYYLVDEITKIKNYHITKFIESQKCEKNIQGKKNANTTINNRIKAINKLLNYLKSTGKFDIEDNIITKYDKLRESESMQIYVSEQEIAKLIYTILNANDDEKYEQHKAILTILLDTGRRIHEVLVLDYNCYKNGKVFFHKTKKGKSNWQQVGELTINAIGILKKYATKVKSPIYSELDGLTIRRLVPSKHYKGNSIISESTISSYFDRLQLENNIIDKKGKVKYTLHDLKRIFVSSLNNAGVRPEEIANFLDQDINNIIPYELTNTLPIATLKNVEDKGLLTGKGYVSDTAIKENQIITILNNIDVISRNKMNLISKINSPSQSLPQFLGYCVDNISYEICGDLICIACEEYIADSLEDFNKYALKMYKHIYNYKRNETIRRIEENLVEALEKCYDKIRDKKDNDFIKVIREIKRLVRKDAGYEERG